MKKLAVLMMTAMLTVGMLGGCGSDKGNGAESGSTAETSTESTQPESAAPSSEASGSSSEADGGADGKTLVLKDVKVEDYVTLGSYKGLEVTVKGSSLDDKQLETLMLQVYGGSVTKEMGITDRAVADGDTVNIDYVGKKDGTAFENGSAAGYNLTIGSGSFIPGFEEGLIGVKPGETVDLDITFPETYQSAELAGQPVVFTVTLNYILPEMTDEVIASFGESDYTTVEELRQYVTDVMEEGNQADQEAELENAVLSVFMDTCTFNEIPEDIINQYAANIKDGIERGAAANSVDADTYSSAMYGMDMQTFIDTYAVESAKQSIAMQAVANAENLNISDEELQTTLTETAASVGVTEEQFIGSSTREDYREYLMFEKVMRFLMDNAAVNNS